MFSPHKDLDALVADSDLLRLENLLKRFNLFEALGVIRQELRHSDLLACLLDPGRNHGLGATFLREFLRVVCLLTEDDDALLHFDPDALNLIQATVFREQHHIDILVVDDVNRFVLIIENKIGTGEHSDQLNRYYDDVCTQYPGYQIFPLYLTPDGNAPTSARYYAVSYTQVCQIIEKIVEEQRSVLGSDIVLLLEHYAQMLRRHIMSDSGVAELCRSIYQKHK